MERRDFMKAVAGTGAAATAGGIGILATSGGAAATSGQTIGDPDVATSDDGEITYVATETTGRLTWDGFDTPAKQARMMVYVTLQRDGEVLWGENLIHDTEMFELDDNWGSDGEEISLEGDHESGQEGYIASDADWGICQKNREHHYNDGYGLPNNPAPTSQFTAENDGNSQSTGVVLRSVYMLFDENGNELTGEEGYPDRPEAESHFIVTVENEKSTVGFGNEDGDGDTEDSAEVGV